MRKTRFYRLGEWVYCLRWPIIVFWVLALLSCLPFLPYLINPFKITGFVADSSLSAIAEQTLDKKMGYSGTNKFVLIYHSPTLLATDPAFIKKMKNSLSDLEEFPVKHEIIYPSAHQKDAKDKHTAKVLVIIKQKQEIGGKLLARFTSLIKKPSKMSMELGGEPVFVDHVNKQTQIDLYNADVVAAPMAIITMLYVFGSVVAAVIPVLLGGACALVILTTLFFLGHLFTLSIFTLNIALLLGLCLCLDYCLFYISRFREELDKGLHAREAIAATQASAGQAIFFSGLAVLASLSALFLFPVNILFSVAVGGVAAVLYAVLLSTVLLPAFLSVLNSKINLFSIPGLRKNSKQFTNAWHWLAQKIVGHPFPYFLGILVFLLLLGYPFLSAKFGVSDYRIFPVDSPSRDFYNRYSKDYSIKELTPLVLVVKSQDEPILSKKNLERLEDLVGRINDKPDVKKVNSIVNGGSHLSASDYYSLYHMPKSAMSTEVKQLLSTTSTEYMTLINVISKYKSDAPQTKRLIDSLRRMKAGPGLNMEITGIPVKNMDVMHSIYKLLPYAVAWIMLFTFFILMILLRSVFLPIKAIVMTVLSLGACYGALVLVFQDGYLAELLDFERQGMVDISLLVIIFCALFGFSMDYEVFLLSRIKESYDEHADCMKSIVFGIEKSSRIITSAALIVIVLCASFLVADVLMVKAFGLGIAIAIFVDAFLIRTLLVPSTMAIFKNWNWYLPKWLDRVLPK